MWLDSDYLLFSVLICTVDPKWSRIQLFQARKFVISNLTEGLSSLNLVAIPRDCIILLTLLIMSTRLVQSNKAEVKFYKEVEAQGIEMHNSFFLYHWLTNISSWKLFIVGEVSEDLLIWTEYFGDIQLLAGCYLYPADEAITARTWGWGRRPTQQHVRDNNNIFWL